MQKRQGRNRVQSSLPQYTNGAKPETAKKRRRSGYFATPSKVRKIASIVELVHRPHEKRRILLESALRIPFRRGRCGRRHPGAWI